MQFTIALMGLAASYALADDLPVPRNMCGVTGSDGTPFEVVNYGPVMCAISTAPNNAKSPSVPFTDQDCTPAFCVDGTLVDICKGPGNTPGAVPWSEIGANVEKAFDSCGGVPRDSKGNLQDPRSKAAGVQHKPFQWVGDGYSITIRGQDCSQGDYQAAYFHCPYM